MCIRDSVSTEPIEANDEENNQSIKLANSHNDTIKPLRTAIKWYKAQDKAELHKIISLH